MNGYASRSGVRGLCGYDDVSLWLTKVTGVWYQLRCFWLQVIESLVQLAYTSGSQGKKTLSPRGHLAIRGDNFSCQNWALGCYSYGEGRGQGAAQCPTTHRTTPATRNCATQNVSSVAVEKPWLTPMWNHLLSHILNSFKLLILSTH